MKLLMIGCEYAGTTTLAVAISRWIDEVVGGTVFGGLAFHDHWKVAEGGHIGMKGIEETDDERAQEELGWSPSHRQGYHHYLLSYHSAPGFFKDPHHLMIGMHFDDEIYGPNFKGYGEDEADGLNRLSRYFEKAILEAGPDTVLILVKASPEVIRRRMKESPHKYQLIKEGDVESLLGRFEEEFKRSRIGALGRKIVLDTSDSTVEDTLAEFVRKIEPVLSDEDRLRILTHRSLSVEAQPQVGP